ncbi:transcriptional regulator GcvA [Yoonia sp. 2307UL14-13]|uniref:transcriptional regulator GcvA n=1 Tax=Yoonia sp. 2307UL14-13 TaxID=3126506 RepID=UPI00309AA779
MADHLPPLAALRAFEAVARLGSFTEAAGELNLTQTAVSHQIKLLEERLNCQMFFRMNRAIALTPEGEVYLESVRPSLKALEDAGRAVKGATDGSSLSISVYPSFAARWLVPRLNRFQSQHPEISIKLDISQELEDLQTRKFDLSIRFGRGKWSGHRSTKLFDETLLPVASPTLLRDKPVTKLSDLSAHVALHDEACDGSQDGWTTWLAVAGEPDLSFAGHMTFSDSFLLLDAAVTGQGIALGRAVLIRDDLEAGRLVTLPGPHLEGTYSYWMVEPHRQTEGSNVLLFKDWLTAETRAQQMRKDAHLKLVGEGRDR